VRLARKPAAARARRLGRLTRCPRDSRGALLRLTAELVARKLEAEPWLRLNAEHELGICDVVASCGEEACRKLGIKARRRVGVVQLRGKTVEGHHWLELSGGLILDSPLPGQILLGTEAERGARYTCSWTHAR
jgi:hypothetical protein